LVVTHSLNLFFFFFWPFGEEGVSYLKTLGILVIFSKLSTL
jgi:hypothetical protein